MFWLVILLAALPTVSFGAFQTGSSDAVRTGMGGASVAVQESRWGSVGNPAILSVPAAVGFAVGYTPARFGLSELASGSLLYFHTTNWGMLNATISHSGFSLYREITAGMGVGWSFMSGMQVGLNVRYFHLAIEGYGDDQTIGVQIGLLYTPYRDVSIGFTADNVNAPTIGTSEERLPQVYRTGICITTVENLCLALDLEKDVLHPLQINIGFQYRLSSIIVLRGGTGTEPGHFSGGFGIGTGDLNFEYAFRHHLVLGITHQVGFGFEL